MENENDIGVIVKICKSKVDPILVGGRLRLPQTKMGIPSGPMTCMRMKRYLSTNLEFPKYGEIKVELKKTKH